MYFLEFSRMTKNLQDFGETPDAYIHAKPARFLLAAGLANI